MASAQIIDLMQRQLAAQERRRHRRVPIAVGARLLAAGAEEELPCRTINISCGGALVEATAWPALGARVVLFARDLGRMPGAVVRHLPNEGFGVRFEFGAHKREKMAEVLTLKANPKIAAEIDARRTRRYAADDRAIIVEMQDGRTLPCQILDFSLIGIAVKTPSLRPPLGAWVKVGATYGRVSRFFENGFAIDFGPPTTVSGPLVD